jgi:transcriptional regulator with XRE-family HTH domain
MNSATLPMSHAITARLNTDGLMASVKENFARNLARLLKQKKISNKELAAAVGVSGSAITSWIKERSSPELARLEVIANVLGVTALDLLRDEQVERPAVSGRDLDAIITEIASSRGYKLVPKDS